MTFSSLATRTVSTPNQESRRGNKIQYIVLHHEAGTSFEAVLNSWHTGVKDGSANYTVSNEGAVVGVVPEELRSWTLADFYWDAISVTFEVENESVGGSWPVSAKAHEATAQVVADVCRRYGIPVDREHIMDHGEVYTRHHASYATACAGGLDVDWIVERVKHIINETGVVIAKPKPVVKPASTTVQHAVGWKFVEPSASVQKAIQAELRERGRYGGPVDGDWGVESRKGIQRTIAVGEGYDGPIDGDIREVGCTLIQKYARDYGDYTGPVDGILGPNSWAGFLLGLRRP